jgi:hypothetical protein
MSKWFRFNADAIRHPKVTQLSESHKWLWVQLLCLAAENGGKLEHEGHLKVLLNKRLDHLLEGLKQLIRVGLIDVIDGGYIPHDWEHYQMKSSLSTERVKEWRRKRNVSETRHDNEDDNDNISDIIKDDNIRETRARERAAVSASIESAFDDFWTAWPHKVGKPAAAKSFAKAMKAHGFETIMAGLERYIRDKPPDRPWLNPATFLNQERFLDSPAPESSRPRRSGDGMSSVMRHLMGNPNGKGQSFQFSREIKDITPTNVPESGPSDPNPHVHEPPRKPSGSGEILDFRSAGTDARRQTKVVNEAGRTLAWLNTDWE